MPIKQLSSFNISEFTIKAVRNHINLFRSTLNVEELRVVEWAADKSMCPPERVVCLYRSVKAMLVTNPNISLIEFGVYSGGMLGVMEMARQASAADTAEIIGFDTFEGHVNRPNEDEIDIHGTFQAAVYDKIKSDETSNGWANYTLDGVVKNLKTLARNGAEPSPRLVKGDAVKTAKILGSLTKPIGILRLDMDWYEPTSAALFAARDKLSPEAVIICDDYGHHSGAKQALDEFLPTLQRKYDSTMTDYSCRRIKLLG